MDESENTQLEIQETMETPKISEKSGKVSIHMYPDNGYVGNSISNNRYKEVINSWKGCLTIVPVNALDNSQGTPSLRQAQVSALYSIMSHFTGHEQNTATVIMPTGTGKTETMLASVCGLPVERALVIVPTISLREQILKKFLKLGILRELKAIKEDTLNPVVAHIEGGFDSQNQLDLLLKSNVIITTPHSLANVDSSLRDQLYCQCSHLFVDEAHHIKAKNWLSIKKAFSKKPVIQFTATPFREDQQKVDGKIIYNYPISLAQEAGIFRTINFESIYEVGDVQGDIRVAEKAVEKLRSDLDQGYDHILMARCNTKARADEIFEIYREKYSDLNPVLVYSGIKKHKSILNSVVNKEHRIVVCVNMLGEGFDLPELKICALHDIHKSLAITLQFAGRFVRDRSDLGDPTFVANICDKKVEGVLKNLYIENPDWNNVLQKSSEYTIQKEIDFQELIQNSIKNGIEISPENIIPAQSTIVYKVTDNEFLLEIEKKSLERGEEIVSKIDFHETNLTILLMKIDAKTKWAPQSDFAQTEYRLLIIYLNTELNLLFIHDSAKSGTRKRLAESVNSSATLMVGDNVFKCFGSIERLVLQNAGLNKGRSGLLRYVMYTGIDIESAITDIAQGTSYKSNLFGKGFEDGNKTSIGCSYKGRIWSMQSGSILEWIEWCDSLGVKLRDSTIDPNAVLNKVLRTKEIAIFPDLYPLEIDWPDMFHERGTHNISFKVDGINYSFDETEISLTSNDKASDGINFIIKSGLHSATYSYELTSSNKHIIKLISGSSITIKTASIENNIEDFFTEEASPSIYFDDGSKVFSNLHIVRPDGFTIPHISSKNITSWPWDIDIQKESQGESKNENTIQKKVIKNLLQDENYWIIFDDDGANEVADIVAFKEEDGSLLIELYHLKYSKESIPGARIGDFYEVCGQAIRSCKWVGEFDKLIAHLKNREKRRINQGKSSRIEKGSFKEFDLLSQHAGRLKKRYKVFVVQPGLDIEKCSSNILELLGSTDIYVNETTGDNLKVIGSKSS